MVKILTVEQIREADNYTIKNEPISSVDLMERASKMLFRWIDHKFQKRKKEITFYIYCGIGNNGGDGLALARFLADSKYSVNPFLVKPNTTLSADCQEQLNRLTIEYELIDSALKDVPSDVNSIIIDALFGSGLSRPIEGFLKELINQLNQSTSLKVAIDMPSGLYGEDNSKNDFEAIFKANYTLCFQCPRLSFLFPSNNEFVGEWYSLDIGLMKTFIANQYTPYNYLSADLISETLIVRESISHKGSFGHALIVAGSKGKIGAAILSSLSCLRSGVGLLTSHVPAHAAAILHESIAEVMLSCDKELNELSEVVLNKEYDAIGIGPGIGTSDKTQGMFKKLVNDYRKPMVVDADALNILSQNPDWLNKLNANSILTPHPGEFKRLVGEWGSDYERLQKQIYFAEKYNVIIVLKGKNTSIASPDGKVFFNSTGNSGMATAGSGDVLTGIITSFLAQGYQSIDAAILGVYIHGLAGDFAKEKMGEESLIASDIIDFLPPSFKRLKSN